MGKSGADLTTISEERVKMSEQNTENLMKIGLKKNKEVMITF